MNDYIPQDPYFNKVVHWFLAEKKEIGEEQFLQLRFITAMVREGKCRVEDLPQNRELDKIISGCKVRRGTKAQQHLHRYSCEAP